MEAARSNVDDALAKRRQLASSFYNIDDDLSLSIWQDASEREFRGIYVRGNLSLTEGDERAKVNSWRESRARVVTPDIDIRFVCPLILTPRTTFHRIVE